MNFFNFLFKRKPIPVNIEVDDSGSGSLYGGIIILVSDGKKDFFREVSLKFFSIKDKAKRINAINTETSKIVKKGLKALNARKNITNITICQGNTFNKTEENLKKCGFKVKRTKIIGRTNDEAEKAFSDLLGEKYGITNYNPKDYKKENLRQYQILRSRRDFKNVKQNVNNIENMKKEPQSSC